MAGIGWIYDVYAAYRELRSFEAARPTQPVFDVKSGDATPAIRDRKADFVLTLLFGWTGYVHFRKKQIGLGILWLCTLGLLCVGWIYDIYKEYKELTLYENVTVFGHDLKDIGILYKALTVACVVGATLVLFGIIAGNADNNGSDDEDKSVVTTTTSVTTVTTATTEETATTSAATTTATSETTTTSATTTTAEPTTTTTTTTTAAEPTTTTPKPTTTTTTTTTTAKRTTTTVNPESVTVYITPTGNCYHTSFCRYYDESCTPMTLKEAQEQGYTACSWCH